ncbi:hypothetical protein CQY20_07380 [Mycolicibacterium agri]|uniref:Uncharacterized protein n=1 Tax=Mycolicibacterium agri TaxID=36811 RepID=A0A2A7N8F9_MYCAG|nr:hypothetical protein [Mycolicibacterium agri]PEG40402.1 hypothetical protein CQY20_07380 [Mycolicibacterium agri]GFG51897.1 hypothetical protein MAGR_33380 [Mycolicibacterium agri]
MASTKYIGYLGGAAVAAGVGAAIAVAGAATASADTTEDGVKSEPAKHETKTDRPKPLEKLTRHLGHAADQVTKAASSHRNSSTDKQTAKSNDANVSATQITVRKPKLTPQEFEAQQVERLKRLFQPRESAAPTAATTNNDNDVVVQAEPNTGLPNPFGATDHEPVGIPTPVVQIRDQLSDAAPKDLKPFVREGVEQAYRGTQMVPWVNAIVPISKIVPKLGDALGGDLDARQIIVNELIKTTPPGSFLYYGYDIVADLTNQEDPARKLKEGAFSTAWNFLDPLGLLHDPEKGLSGIEGDRPPGIGNSLGA